MTTLLISCKSSQNITAYCPSPVDAPTEVKAWFKDHKPLPLYLKEYLDAIGDEQKAIHDNCKIPKG